MSLKIKSSLVPLVKPYTRKRECRVVCAGSVQLTGTYWSEGSRSEYHRVEISTGKVLPISYSRNPPQFGGTESEVTLSPGQVIIQNGTFCGKPATCYIYARATDLPEILGFPDRFAEDTPECYILDFLADRGFDFRRGLSG